MTESQKIFSKIANICASICEPYTNIDVSLFTHYILSNISKIHQISTVLAQIYERLPESNLLEPTYGILVRNLMKDAIKFLPLYKTFEELIETIPYEELKNKLDKIVKNNYADNLANKIKIVENDEYSSLQEKDEIIQKLISGFEEEFVQGKGNFERKPFSTKQTVEMIYDNYAHRNGSNHSRLFYRIYFQYEDYDEVNLLSGSINILPSETRLMLIDESVQAIRFYLSELLVLFHSFNEQGKDFKYYIETLNKQD